MEATQTLITPIYVTDAHCCSCICCDRLNQAATVADLVFSVVLLALMISLEVVVIFLD